MISLNSDGGRRSLFLSRDKNIIPASRCYCCCCAVPYTYSTGTPQSMVRDAVLTITPTLHFIEG
ncbi:hypothetical protein B9Z19DRAFT_1076874 [Tuber borchii]|uniref:Uncharacterized protein n=1 Tax=Tuber borchii TaxID=42251 RepID=A0A2T7A1I7_TUBBO|nr:hypothetical protein B9Z19DRAFT_1076874 [Tuber borchii]